MISDVRETPEYAEVAEQLRRLHEPAFGRPHALADPQVTPDGRRVVVTGSVFDRLEGLPRTAIYNVQDGVFPPVTTARGSAHHARFSPEGDVLAFLSDRAKPGVFQLYLLAVGRHGESVAAPGVPGTVEYAHWSPDGRRLVLGVAAPGADQAGGQGSGTTATEDSDRPAWHPVIESGVSRSGWRSLWLYTVGTGELSRLSPEGLNCWEAGWCGDSTVLAVTSDAPDEAA
jgi:dipeptidyl aminopeptidase/acylaminoacyl peptidase